MVTEIDLIFNSNKPVLVIGAAGLDIVGRVDGEVKTNTSNPAIIRSSFGGTGRNVAENLARLGQPVDLITVVGEDYTGDQLLEQLSTAGVGLRSVLRTAEHFTGSYLAVVSVDGELQLALDDMNAMQALTPRYLRDNKILFKEAGLLFLDSNLPPKTLRTAMSLARQTGLPVCADPTSTALANRLTPYLSRIYLLTPNSLEASIFYDRDIDARDQGLAMAAAKQLVTKGVTIAIITLAEFGVCYATSDTNGYIPAITTDITDPTGGGDALTATVIFALMNEIPLDDAVRLGVSAASLTLRHRGAVIPDLSLEMLYDNLLI